MSRSVTSVWIYTQTMDRLRQAKAITGKSIYRLTDDLLNSALDARPDLREE